MHATDHRPTTRHSRRSHYPSGRLKQIDTTDADHRYVTDFGMDGKKTRYCHYYNGVLRDTETYFADGGYRLDIYNSAGKYSHSHHYDASGKRLQQTPTDPPGHQRGLI